jgi:hypothetical protein
VQFGNFEERRKFEMAKVINPLLSGSASGQLGHMMTFDKRGFVRQYVVPSNPQTVNQMLVRNTLGDLQRTLKLLGATLRAELKSQFGYRWNSVIIGELMANGNAVLDAYTAEFTAFTAPQKAEWAAEDALSPITLEAGSSLYACASAVYDIGVRLGSTLTLTLPAAANAATVGAEWTA